MGAAGAEGAPPDTVEARGAAGALRSNTGAGGGEPIPGAGGGE